ncbi:hypothetical protein CPB86DRAFT_140002 [Serendipita vermifera]|nr:hypothetical protein CPB86DRAFT_140002 [Serendipita vermifera]
MSAHAISLTTLPTEIIQDILEHLVDEYCLDYEDTLSLNQWIQAVTLCNRRLRQIALPFFYHTICVFGLDQLEQLIFQLIERPAYAGFVRRLTTDGIRVFVHKYVEKRKDNLLFMEEAGRRGLSHTLMAEGDDRFQRNDLRASLLVHLLPSLEELFIRTGEALTLNLFDSKCADKPLLSTKLRTWVRCGDSILTLPFHISKLIPVILHPLRLSWYELQRLTVHWELKAGR